MVTKNVWSLTWRSAEDSSLGSELMSSSMSFAVRAINCANNWAWSGIESNHIRSLGVNVYCAFAEVGVNLKIINMINHPVVMWRALMSYEIPFLGTLKCDRKKTEILVNTPSFWTAGGFVAVLSNPTNCPGGAFCWRIPTALQKCSANCNNNKTRSPKINGGT